MARKSTSNDAGELDRILEGSVLLAVEGSFDLSDADPVFVGMAWDDSGYTPASAMYVLQNRYESEDAALQQAFEMLETLLRERESEYAEELIADAVKEAEEDSDEPLTPEELERAESEGYDSFTEGWDGKAFTLTAKGLWKVLANHPRAWSEGTLTAYGEDEEGKSGEITPEELEIWDAGTFVADRFSVRIGSSIFTMSEDATSPGGVNMYAGEESELPSWKQGKEIEFKWLPDAVKEAIAERQWQR